MGRSPESYLPGATGWVILGAKSRARGDARPLSPARAMAQFLETPEGKALYEEYVRASKR